MARSQLERLGAARGPRAALGHVARFGPAGAFHHQVDAPLVQMGCVATNAEADATDVNRMDGIQVAK